MSTKVLTSFDFTHLELLNIRHQNLSSDPGSAAAGWSYFNTSTGKLRVFNGTTWDEMGGGGGSVTSFSIISANGFYGSVATAGTTPVLTITTTVTGMLKGNGTAMSPATAGTDYSVGTSALATGILKTTTGTGSLSIAVAGDFPILNQSTTGSAAKLTTARTIAGNSFDGSANITFANKFIMQGTSDAGLTGAQFMGSLGTGLVKNTVTTGVQTIAVAGTDFAAPTNGASTNVLTSNGAGGYGTALIVDTDGALAANSDARLATQKAVKTYVDASVTSATSFQGAISAASNPNYPAATKGQAWVISAAGKIGGASGISVDVGDLILATAANAGGTQASVGTSWIILEHNLVGALLAANNLSDLASASTARTNLGLGAAAVLGVGAGLSTSGGNIIADRSVLPGKYSATIGDGSSTSIPVTHSLGTKDVVAMVRDNSTDAMVICDVVSTSTSVTTFVFATAPSSSQYRVTIIG